jgi:hypothetical protein
MRLEVRMPTRLVGIMCLVTLGVGCHSAFMQGVAEGLAAASSPTPTGVTLMVFGGPGHKT